LTLQSNLSALPLFSDDVIIDPYLLTQNNFFNFSNETTLDSLEDTYDNYKYINFIHHINYKNLLQLKTSGVFPLSYTQVIDNFRPDYEDNS
jgi:hypothetical protein